MFVLSKGRVAIIKAWRGQNHLLRYLEAGDCFGEMALLDLYPRSASILAIEDCFAIELTTDSLYRLYEKDLEQFALIFINIGREISRRLREADRRLFERAVTGKIVDPSFIPHAI